MKQFFLLLIATFMSAGLIAQGFGGNSNLPDYQSQTNIDYVGDNHIGHKLDIYYPNDEKATHPVIIHIYGSAWAANNMKGSADLTTVGVAALEAGYIFVAPNHRSSSDGLFPAQLNDIKALVRYLRANAQALDIDTSFIAVSGFSSGGHLAALMGVTRGINTYTVGSASMNMEGDLGDYTNQSSSIDAVCSWSGMVEIRNHESCDIPGSFSSFIEALMGRSFASNPDAWALASANTYVDAKDAPAIIFHGSADYVYPQCVSENLYNNLTSAGIECEYYPHNSGHSVNADYTDEMITFFNRIKEEKAAKEGIENMNLKTAPSKILHDAQILILRGEKRYTMQGQEVR